MKERKDKWMGVRRVIDRLWVPLPSLSVSCYLDGLLSADRSTI